jgi:hypothetical protein
MFCFIPVLIKFQPSLCIFLILLFVRRSSCGAAALPHPSSRSSQLIVAGLSALHRPRIKTHRNKIIMLFLLRTVVLMSSFWIFGVACLFSLSSALPIQVVANDILLIPNATTSQPAAAFMFFPGAGLGTDQYMSLLLQLQQSFTSPSLWVAISGTTFSSDADITRLLSDLQDKGFPSGSLIFAGGHSSELAQLQHCIALNTSACSEIHAAVLLGFPLLRQYRTTFPVPVLTIAGTLDGVSRVTRAGAESLFHALSQEAPSVCKLQSSVTPNLLCPVIAIDGISHMSFATGTPSSLIHQLDLKPEVAESDAHTQISKFISAFMSVVAAPSSSAIQILESGVASSEALMSPFIEAMQAEGSPWIRTWCNSDFPTNTACNYPKYPDASLPPGPKPSPTPLPPSDCICGSPFVRSFAQTIMSNFSSSSHASAVIAASDAFHDVSDVHPFHLPHIWNSCKLSDSSCTLNVTSVTMPILEPADNFDGTRAPISALEFRTKLKSRQATWEAVGLPDTDLDTTDGSLAICRSINELSVSLALKSASASVLKRYTEYGELLVPVDDVKSGIGPEGPKWIQDELKYTRVNRPDGSIVTTVQSWTFDTPNVNHGDVPYIITAGYHYCKILSPARSMEWVMVDSLRLRGSLGSAGESSFS